MGRTIQSATQTWIEEEKALQRFTRALRREDQAVMKELIHLSRLHIAEPGIFTRWMPILSACCWKWPNTVTESKQK